MQINRLFEIIYILLHKKRVTARELAEQLGVSRRTICRDIDALSVAGIPIYTEKGKGGGISLLPDFVLSKSILSEQEQHEILSALHGLSNIKTSDTANVLQKVSATFNKTATNWLEVDFSGWHSDGDFFNDFKVAIIERRVVEFDYYNTYGEKRFRRVEPAQLWFKSKAWYLRAFCLTKRSVRLYKLSRIKNLAVTSEHFAERDLAAVPDDPGGDRELKWIELKLRIEPEMAYQVYDDFVESEIEKQPDGGFVVTTTIPENQGLYSFLLYYRSHIEVISPQSVRDAIKIEAEKILKKYCHTNSILNHG